MVRLFYLHNRMGVVVDAGEADHAWKLAALRMLLPDYDPQMLLPDLRSPWRKLLDRDAMPQPGDISVMRPRLPTFEKPVFIGFDNGRGLPGSWSPPSVSWFNAAFRDQLLDGIAQALHIPYRIFADNHRLMAVRQEDERKLYRLIRAYALRGDPRKLKRAWRIWSGLHRVNGYTPSAGFDMLVRQATTKVKLERMSRLTAWRIAKGMARLSDAFIHVLTSERLTADGWKKGKLDL